jgi:hypothetical protein
MAKNKHNVTQYRVAKEVPVEYYGMEDLPLLYSDGVTVQSNEHGFIITYFQSEQPIALTEEDQAKIKKLPMRCIGRLFIPPALFESTIEAFQGNLIKHQSRSLKANEELDKIAKTEKGSS